MTQGWLRTCAAGGTSRGRFLRGQAVAHARGRQCDRRATAAWSVICHAWLAGYRSVLFAGCSL